MLLLTVNLPATFVRKAMLIVDYPAGKCRGSCQLVSKKEATRPRPTILSPPTSETTPTAGAARATA